jgi:hypothetical protein
MEAMIVLETTAVLLTGFVWAGLLTTWKHQAVDAAWAHTATVSGRP